jgi:methyl-accepting chemotaxis protein
LIRSIVEPMRHVLGATEDLRAGEGDLTKRLPALGAEFGTLAASLNGFVAKLHDVMLNVRTSAESVKTASVQISAGSVDLSQRAQEEASTLEETAANMEELTSTVKQNADNAKKADRLAQQASEVALAGGAVVSQVVTTMTGIEQSSKRIADITAVIDSIAFQTNILALNAAVEAARAGEQGRGFAVVASEVRVLAQRSAEAAKEIRDLIAESTDKVQQGTKLVEQAGSTMQQIVDAVKKVTETVAEISTASQEQSMGIDQVKIAVDQLEKVVQQNASFIEETSNTAASMDSQAEQLLQAVRGFRLAEAANERVAPKVERSAPPQRTATAALRSAGPARPPRPRTLGKQAAVAAAGHEEWKEF